MEPVFTKRTAGILSEKETFWNLCCNKTQCSITCARMWWGPTSLSASTIYMNSPLLSFLSSFPLYQPCSQKGTLILDNVFYPFGNLCSLSPFVSVVQSFYPPPSQVHSAPNVYTFIPMTHVKLSCHIVWLQLLKMLLCYGCSLFLLLSWLLVAFWKLT